MNVFVLVYLFVCGLRKAYIDLSIRFGGVCGIGAVDLRCKPCVSARQHGFFFQGGNWSSPVPYLRMMAGSKCFQDGLLWCPSSRLREMFAALSMALVSILRVQKRSKCFGANMRAC